MRVENLMSFDEKYPNARATAKTPPHWPPDVKILSFTGGDLLGADSTGKLFWDGRPIKVSKKLELTSLQRIYALALGVAAIVGGLGSGINDGFEFGCRQGWWSGGCSTQHAYGLPDEEGQSGGTAEAPGVDASALRPCLPLRGDANLRPGHAPGHNLC